MINSGWNKSGSTLGNNSACYNGFVPDTFPYPNLSQALYAHLESDQSNHTDLPLAENFGTAGTAQYGNGGEYSPKQLIQMEDIYPNGSSNTPQRDSSYHFNSAYHPWAESGIVEFPDRKMDSPLIHRDSDYETTSKSLHGIHLDVNKDDILLTKWQNEGYVHFFDQISCKPGF